MGAILWRVKRKCAATTTTADSTSLANRDAGRDDGKIAQKRKLRPKPAAAKPATKPASMPANSIVQQSTATTTAAAICNNTLASNTLASTVYVVNQTAVEQSSARAMFDPTVHDSRRFSSCSSSSSSSGSGGGSGEKDLLCDSVDGIVDHSTFGSVWHVMWSGGGAARERDGGGGGARKKHNLRRRKYYVLKQTPSIGAFRRVWLTNADRRAEERRAIAECETMRRLCASVDRHANLCYAQHVWIEPMPIDSTTSGGDSFVRGCLLFERKPSDLFTYLNRIARRNEQRWKAPPPSQTSINNGGESSSSLAVVLPEHMTHRRFARHGLPLETAGHILKQVISAVAFLHTQFGLVHNDIKPENVLYDAATQQCWLTDFGGTSEPHPSDCAYDNRTATRFFASPERRLKLPFCFKSDSWSLGMLAIECVYGSVMVDRWYDQPTWNAALGAARCHANSQSTYVREPISSDILDTLCPLQSTSGSDDINDRVLEAEYRALLLSTVRLLPADRLVAQNLLSQYSVLLH